MPERNDTLRALTRLAWVAHNLRWLILTAIGALLFYTPAGLQPNWLAVALFVGLGLYNALLAFLEANQSWSNRIHVAIAASDTLFCLGMVALADSPRLLWIGLLPVLTVALRLGWLPGLVMTAIWVALQAALAWYLHPNQIAIIFEAVLTGALIAPAALGASFAGQQVRTSNRPSQRTTRTPATEQARSEILRQHARAIYEMASMMSASLNYKDVVEAALNFGATGAEGTANTSMVCAALFFENDELHVESARRFIAADNRVVCGGDEGVLGEVLRTGEAQVIANPTQDPELKQFVSLHTCKSLMALALRAGYESYGVIIYAHPRPDFFDDDQRALLTAVVNQAIIALQNARLYRSLRMEKERILEVQDDAQKKLARDLHDGPTQGVAALAMRANFVRRLLERDPKAASEELFKMEELARKTTKEIRHMLFTLRPLVLESQGLGAALQQLGEKMHETHSQTVVVEVQPNIEQRLELNHQGVIFYIVEEAVNNARKHAQAAHIWVRIKMQPSDIMLVQIQDDGVGFDLSAVEANYDKRGSLGMVNLKERTEMLGGALQIDSTEGKGTTINVYVPLTDEARQKLRY